MTGGFRGSFLEFSSSLSGLRKNNMSLADLVPSVRIIDRSVPTRTVSASCSAYLCTACQSYNYVEMRMGLLSLTRFYQV